MQSYVPVLALLLVLLFVGIPHGVCLQYKDDFSAPYSAKRQHRSVDRYVWHHYNGNGA
jgi:hypothetical protein